MNDPAKDAELRAAIIAIIERSATFEERAAAEGMIAKPCSDDEVMAICKAVESSREDMRVRGPIAASFARLYATASLAIPPWATALESLLADDAPAYADDFTFESDEDQIARDVAVAFSGFLQTASTWLDRAIASSQTRIEPAGRRGLLAWLRRAWTVHARRVLAAEGKASGLASATEYAQKLASRREWLTLFATYPVLGRLLGLELEVWQRECALLVRRVAADWTQLGESGEPTLLDVTVLALKRPVYAAPPLRVTFASGQRAVYHGKDLRIAAWFADLVRELGRSGLRPVLEPCAVLARERYAWVAYVDAAPCTEQEEVERYFTRVGMYLRLFQALRTVDMHNRNLIAAHEHPVFFDLETLLQPPRNLLGGTPVAQAARERYDASPLAVGLLPLWLTGEPGYRAANVGGLNRGGKVAFPGMPKVTEVVSTVPQVGDEPSTMGDHLPEILAGYRAMSAALATNEHVRASLERAANLRVSVLWRSFFMHKRMADASVLPLLLTDGRLRDAFLTRLVLGLPDDLSRTLALRELWAIRDGASPSFEAAPGSDAIYLADGLVIPGVFSSPALQRVTFLRTPADENRDLDAIASAIGCEAQFHGEPPPSIEPRVTAAADASTPLAHAIAIGDFILGEGVSAGDEMLWVGANWLPTAGTRRVDVLSLDLLSGTAGIAVLFAYLHKRSGEARFRDAATRTLGPIRREVLDAMARGQFRGGAFLGASAQLYALGKCAELLDDWILLETVKRYLAAVPPAVLSPGAPRDVVLGAAGLLLVAANLLDPFSRPANLVHVANELRQQPTTGRALYVDAERFLGGLPNEREGVAWALARWDGPSSTVTLPDDASPLTRIACGQPQSASVAAAHGSSLSDLIVVLAARDAYRDHALTDRARAIADDLVARRRKTGLWLEDAYVAERYHLSAITGLSALALAFARIDAPQLPCCPRLVY